MFSQIYYLPLEISRAGGTPLRLQMIGLCDTIVCFLSLLGMSKIGCIYYRIDSTTIIKQKFGSEIA